MPADAQSVAILRKNVVALWSVAGLPAKGSKKPPAPKIKELGDLAGHRVGVIGRTKANVTLLRVILTESGVNADKVAVTQFATNQIAEMARDPTIEAFMAVGPLDSKITIEAIAATAKARGEPKFLPIEVSETLAKKHPRYEAEEIPGSTFSSVAAAPRGQGRHRQRQPSDHRAEVACRKPRSAPSSGNCSRCASRSPGKCPAAAKIEKPDTDKDAALPAHQGAAAYIDGTERTFLEKYTDYFWGAILVLSGLGSAGAWLRHYLKRDEREQYDEHRDDLLAIISKVRLADTPDELTAMQNEVDGMLREALDCYDDGAIEEGDLAAIGLVLDQFNHAVADRRVAIGLAAPEPARMRAL